MAELFKKLAKYGWMIDLIGKLDGETRGKVIEGYKTHKSWYEKEGVDSQLKEMLKCANCPNMCRFDCPTLQITKKETYSPANKAKIGYFMGMGHIPFDNPSAIEALYMCCNCNACRIWCPMDLSTGEMLTTARWELEKRNLLPEPVNAKKKNLEGNGSLYDESIFKQNASAFDINDEKPDVFYYMGCNTLKSRPEIVKDHIEILKSAGLKVETKMMERVCCGSPINHLGAKTTAIELGKKNADLLNESKAKIIISDCPGCSTMLKKGYEALSDKIKIKKEVYHSSDFFLKLINEGKIKLTTSVNETISFHDPCILNRPDENVSNANREILQKIPGLKVNKLLLEKKETRCCGFGGGFGIKNTELAKAMGKDRYEQLAKSNPDHIVSACPTCEQSFNLAKEKSTVNISYLIKKAMGK